jgi:hypothetical protein
MSWRRRGDSGKPAQKAPGPTPYPAAGYAVAPAPSSHEQREIGQSAKLATTPMPFDVESTHESVIVCASASKSFAVGESDPGGLLVWVLEELGRQASQRGCDGVYGIQHTLAVDHGIMHITAIGTGSRPLTDMDGPPRTGTE